jgi:hypothetical protein
MDEVRIGRPLEQLHGQVLAGIGAGRAIGQPAGRCFGALYHLGDGFRAARRVCDEHNGDVDQLGHGGKLAEHVGPGAARQIGVEQQRPGRADAQRVAVGRRLGEQLQAERAAGAGPVLDHDLAPQSGAELIRDDTRGAVRRCSRRERNDDLNGSLRWLRMRRPARDCNRECRQ